MGDINVAASYNDDVTAACQPTVSRLLAVKGVEAAWAGRGSQRTGATARE